MSALKPGDVWAIGDSVESGNAKVEVRTRVAPAGDHGAGEREAIVVVRDPLRAGSLVTIELDAGELACLRDACNDALRWVRR